MEAQAAVRGVGRAPTPLPTATALLVIRLFVCLFVKLFQLCGYKSADKRKRKTGIGFNEIIFYVFCFVIDLQSDKFDLLGVY